MIGGFIVGGSNSPSNVAIRAIGPSLANASINNFLPDPTLALRDGNGNLAAFNDNWQDNPAQASQLMQNGVAPFNG